MTKPKPHRVSDKRFGLNHAVDAGFIPGAQPSDSPSSGDSDSSDSDSDSHSSGSKGTSELAASFRLFSEAMLRMEIAELEMMKARESARLAAENRRLETEAELTQLILRTQLQVASVVTRTLNGGRKRKRSNDESSQREGAILMSLLQCNLLI